MKLQFNFNTILITVGIILMILFQKCGNDSLENQVMNSQRLVMSELVAFQEESYENSKDFQGKVLTQKELLESLGGELKTLQSRMIANGRNLKNLQSSTSFLTQKVDGIEMPSVLNTIPDTINDTIYRERPVLDIYPNYLSLPKGSYWEFSDKVLSGRTTLLDDGDATTEYQLNPMQFDVDIYRKWKLFGPDKYSADITSSTLPVNNASVTVKRMPRPRLVFSVGGGVAATWDGSKIVYGPSIGAQIGIPLITIVSK